MNSSPPSGIRPSAKITIGVCRRGHTHNTQKELCVVSVAGRVCADLPVELEGPGGGEQGFVRPGDDDCRVVPIENRIADRAAAERQRVRPCVCERPHRGEWALWIWSSV